MTRIIRLLVAIVQRATGSLHPRTYPALVEAVESGVRWGWHRAHKHVDDPSEDVICDAIAEAVLGEICERFALPPEVDE